MKKILFFFALLITVFFSCKKPQSFDYKGVKNFKLEKLGFDYSTVSMDLIYYNPNSFGVDLKKVDCDVYLNNRYAGKYLLDTTLHIGKNAEFILPSKMKVDMNGLFKNGLDVLLHNEVLVTLKGTTRVGKANIFINYPFNYEGKFQVPLF